MIGFWTSEVLVFTLIIEEKIGSFIGDFIFKCYIVSLFISLNKLKDQGLKAI